MTLESSMPRATRSFGPRSLIPAPRPRSVHGNDLDVIAAGDAPGADLFAGGFGRGADVRQLLTAATGARLLGGGLFVAAGAALPQFEDVRIGRPLRAALRTGSTSRTKLTGRQIRYSDSLLATTCPSAGKNPPRKTQSDSFTTGGVLVRLLRQREV
jgi:hypothetical protein